MPNTEFPLTQKDIEELLKFTQRKPAKDSMINKHNQINQSIYCGYFPNGQIRVTINETSYKLTVREAKELAKDLVSCIGSVCTQSLEKQQG